MTIYEEHRVFYRRYSIGEMKPNFVAYIFTKSIIRSLIRCVRRTGARVIFSCCTDTRTKGHGYCILTLVPKSIF